MVMVIGDSEAIYDQTEEWGEVYQMNLAPGYSYRYTPEYPDGLEVETSILQAESEGLNAMVEPTSGQLVVTLRDGVSVGEQYDLILMAHSDTGGVSQTIYRHLRFNVVNGLEVDPAQVINDIIIGAEITFQAQAETGATTAGGDPLPIMWSVKAGTQLPDGLSLSGNTVSGTPTKTGHQTVSLTASSAGQTADLIVDFTVWQQIVAQDDETITSWGNEVQSTVKPQSVSEEDPSGDLTLTWAVDEGTADQLPAGFELDPVTGIVSGSSTEAKVSVVTITGTHSGSLQETSKVVMIRTEPVIDVIATPEELVTYPGSSDVTSQLTVPEGVSTPTWSIVDYAGVSVDPSTGVLTVTNAAGAGTITINVTSAYGQTATGSVEVVIENPPVVSGETRLATTAGTTAEITLTSSIEGSTWSVSEPPVGVSLTIGEDSGVLSLNCNIPVDEFTATITVTSPHGQTSEYQVTCQVVPVLQFVNPATGGAIAYAV